jgi:hypothetical protein
MAMNVSRRSCDRPARFGAVVAVAALALLTPGLAAQDDEAEVHPAHIHTGTCAELGDVVIPLSDIAHIGDDAERTGPASAIPVKSSVTVVDMPLQEIIDGGHAINVHLSAEEIDVYIACGAIGGYVVTDSEGRTELFVGLQELNDSGHTGVARLGIGEDPNQTEVSILLVERNEMQ